MLQARFRGCTADSPLECIVLPSRDVDVATDSSSTTAAIRIPKPVAIVKLPNDIYERIYNYIQ